MLIYMNYFFKKSVCVFRLVVYFEEKRRRLKLFFIFIFFLVLPANAIQFKPLLFFFFFSSQVKHPFYQKAELKISITLSRSVSIITGFP
jgi:hypothetical protein